ncbi:MAG: hypothetical protein ACKODB_09320, partial [Betaproteobacteria bacterium]
MKARRLHEAQAQLFAPHVHPPDDGPRARQFQVGRWAIGSSLQSLERDQAAKRIPRMTGLLLD